MMRGDMRTTSRGCALFYVKDEIEHAGRDPEAHEMQELVVQRQGVREVCEPEESQDQHDDESEHNKPLHRTYSASERA